MPADVGPRVPLSPSPRSTSAQPTDPGPATRTPRSGLLLRIRLLLACAALLLAACGGGDAGGGQVTLPPPPPPPPPEVEDPEALLTDAQLATAPDPDAKGVDAVWARWIGANHHTVRSLTSHRHDDLAFLAPLLAGKRLVQLGESGHGVREFSRAKTRLIRYLHEELGYDVLAFESGLYECWRAGREAAVDAPETTMRRCVFGVWHTQEVRELFEYVRQTRQTARPLRLAGFDVQLSGADGGTGAADLMAEAAAKVDPAYAERVRAMDAAFLADEERLSRIRLSDAAQADTFRAVEARGRLIARYDSLVAFLDANEARIAAAYAADPEAPLVARQQAWSRVPFLRQRMAANSAAASSLHRDRAMAENLTFLADRLYPGEKVIVWAHNAHVQHDASAVEGTYMEQSMGHWVAGRHRAQLYTVGLFMYRGSAALNTRQVYPVAGVLPNSLEALFYTVRKRWVFVDLLGAPPSPGTEWMYTPTRAKDWGISYQTLVPRDQYDGILFIDTVSPPDYLPRQGRRGAALRPPSPPAPVRSPPLVPIDPLPTQRRR